MKHRRVFASLAAGLMIAAGVMQFAACGTQGDGETKAETKTETATEKVTVTETETENLGNLYLDQCEKYAKEIAGRLDRDALTPALLPEADFAAIMASESYAQEIRKLADAMKEYDADSIAVYAFSEDGVTYVYHSRYGEPEDFFTKYSLRTESWIDSGMSSDKARLLKGDPVAFGVHAGNGQIRYTVMLHWFTTEDDVSIYTAVTLLR